MCAAKLSDSVGGQVKVAGSSRTTTHLMARVSFGGLWAGRCSAWREEDATGITCPRWMPAETPNGAADGEVNHVRQR